MNLPLPPLLLLKGGAFEYPAQPFGPHRHLIGRKLFLETSADQSGIECVLVKALLIAEQPTLGEDLIKPSRSSWPLLGKIFSEKGVVRR